MRKRAKAPPAGLLEDLWDRVLTGLVIALFCAPACALLWFVFNKAVAGSGPLLSWSVLWWSIAACGALGFLFPRLSFDVMGKIWELVFAAGRHL